MKESTKPRRIDLAGARRAGFSAVVRDSRASLQQALKLLAAYANFHRLPDATLYHAQVVVDEVVTNVFSHGYADGGEGRVEVSARLGAGCLEIGVVDDAAPFNLLAATEPDVTQEIELRPIGGLGIHIVRSLVSEIDYERRDGRNRLRLRLQLEPAAER